MGLFESFGESWILIMPFSRTLKVLKRDVFQIGYEKVMDFCLGKFYIILKWI